MAMYAQGVELYCAPTVDDRDSWQTTMRHIALEGRCFVLTAVQYTANIRGGSAIYGPLGEEIAAPIYGREAVLTAEVDLGAIARGKYDFDVAGHYARPDVFTLHIDRRAKKAVE
jgi:nitrilase